jgi:UDP-N-acetylmuramoyl-tripeptide--D-alanyl-D-alanine ligase
MTVVLIIAAALAGLAGLSRWLRVSQREHYLPGQVVRSARRWVAVRPPNRLVAGVWLVALVAAVYAAALDDAFPIFDAEGGEGGDSVVAGLLALVAAAAGTAFPVGMSLVGEVRLKLTRRATTQAVIAVAVALVVLGLVGVAGGLPAVTALAPLVALVAVDLAAWLAGPIERRKAARFQAQARDKLTRIGPTVIAVTGSYGKTTVKNHVHDLLVGSFTTVASPASWNNQAGLSRAVNEHVGPDTEVFVAEMGTYGPGEIARMVAWVEPRISMISAIGPVHLERMGSIERIARAKSEILEGAEVAVLNVDHPPLDRLADEVAGERGVELWRVGTDWSRAADLDVLVERRPADTTGTDTDTDTDAATGVADTTDAGTDTDTADPAPGEGGEGDGEGDEVLVVTVRGEQLARVPAGSLHAGNVACAVAAALAAGVPPTRVADRLPGLAPPPNRAVPLTTEAGVTVIDDTFNSNPAGARAAFERLCRLAPHGRKVVVTPGMVELGDAQVDANRHFASTVAHAGADLLVVGWTNRAALMSGHPTADVVRDREAARRWVRANLRPGDAVLWENDLPDHYP